MNRVDLVVSSSEDQKEQQIKLANMEGGTEKENGTTETEAASGGTGETSGLSSNPPQGGEVLGELVDQLGEMNIQQLETPSTSRRPPPNPDWQPAKTGMTPYQGTKRCFGYFKCPNGCKAYCKVCNRSLPKRKDLCSECPDYEWESRSSWANTEQKCLHCRTSVYPYSQRKFEHDDFILPKKHIEHLCQRCVKAGKSVQCQHGAPYGVTFLPSSTARGRRRI